MQDFLIAQNDDPELLEWLANAELRGGSFVSSIARAGLRADHENYPLMRSLLLQMRAKYTEYEPTDEVKAEIRKRGVSENNWPTRNSAPRFEIGR